MAAAFREMTASLYRRIEASERFAQDVAHELKNPLTAARSTAESLAYAKTPEQQKELVRPDPGGIEAAQQAHHRRRQRLAARCRAGAAGDRAGRLAPGPAGCRRRVPRHPERRYAARRARDRGAAAQSHRRYVVQRARCASRPRHHQPARQRHLLLAGERRHHRQRPQRWGRRSRSSSTTRGRASPRTSSRTSSSASTPTGRRPTAPSARTRGSA